MDDEEEDMSSQPTTAQHWAALPYGKFTADEAPGQHLPYGPAPPRNSDAILGLDPSAQHCGGSQPFALSHGNCSSSAVHSPAPLSEPMEDRGDRPARVEEEEELPRGQQEQEQEQEQEEDGGGEEDQGSAAGPAGRAAVSVEVEIGRKLRQIGDQFNHDHAELRRLREALPVWMRLAATLLGLLFPREAMVPLRAEPR